MQSLRAVWTHRYGQEFPGIGAGGALGAENARSRVLVTNGLDFARSYANAIDTDSLSAFRKKCYATHLLVLDDVHLMHQKRAAQDELTRLLDVLFDAGTMILMTTTMTPSADHRLLPRLRSRLSSGLAAPLTVPGIPARRLLLRRLADVHEVKLTDAAIELLASNLPHLKSELVTVPQLNHAVMQLGHAVDEPTSIVDEQRVRLFLLDQAHQRQPTLRSITAKVGKYFSLTSQQLRGSSRRRHIVRARSRDAALLDHDTQESRVGRSLFWES